MAACQNHPFSVFLYFVETKYVTPVYIILYGTENIYV